MKKFIVAISVIVILVLIGNSLYYDFGLYIDFNSNAQVESFVRTEGKSIQINQNGEWTDFTVKGINMGSGEPGKWSTDFDIDEDTYYRWFGQMQDAGANTLRIYTIQADDFYNAFYKYNENREKNGKQPLWLLHGVWVNDYVLNSHMDAYDDEFKETLIKDCRSMIDVIHGQKNISLGHKASMGSGNYRKNISRWVIGYILGVEWENEVVLYTNQLFEDVERYKGKYMYADEKASPFESMLAEVGDKTVEYETDKYKTQKLIAFSNWCTTDPFKYTTDTAFYFNKLAYVNTEHIIHTDKLITGQFVSYHVYPYHPDFLEASEAEKLFALQGGNLNASDNAYQYLKYKLEMTDAPSIYDYLEESDYIDTKGRKNTYLAYLYALNRFHSLPVVITEFGVSTGRGMAQEDKNTGRNQGNMSEQEQGQAIVDCYDDIIKSGCNGGCVFSWQDEWFKRTWNTMHAIDLKRTAYWSDYQTNEQYFGLLSFDPGEEKSIVYVDGDVSEWTKSDIAIKTDNSSLSVKYDEKFIYFMLYKKDLDFEKETLYIPIDTTPKTGSTYCSSNGLKFQRECDFLLTVNGKTNTRLQVQKRYEVLRSTYGDSVYKKNAYDKANIPDKDTPEFVNIDMILKKAVLQFGDSEEIPDAEVFETGDLVYGNANPESENFNSLADFICNGDYVEIKIPWQLLNFADPSKMQIHDDYYDDNYGIEYIDINEMFVGFSVGNTGNRIMMNSVELEGWGNDVTYHERLKQSYYILKDYWTTN